MKTNTKRKGNCPHLVCGLVTAMNADNIIDNHSLTQIQDTTHTYRAIHCRHYKSLRITLSKISHRLSAFFIPQSKTLHRCCKKATFVIIT